MMDLDDARARVRTRIRPLSPISMPVRESLGFVTASSTPATVDHPPLDMSSMDGYAAAAAALPAVRARIAFEIEAGSMPPALPSVQVARIFTGAALPAGADCVVRQELAVRHGDEVDLPSVPSGHFVRKRGEVFAAGDSVLAPHTRITPTRAALLAAAGVQTVEVTSRPRLAIVITGGEVVTDARHTDAEIFDANGPMLAGLAALSGGGIDVTIQHVSDDLPAVCDALERAAESADLVITSGGVSVGDHDLVPRALVELDADIVLHGIRVKPGKPLLVAHGAGDHPSWFVGLPGNPVSALVGWRLFAHPITRALAGDPSAFDEAPRLGRLDEGYDNRGDRVMLRPSRVEWVDGKPVLHFMNWKGSHDLRGAAAANALVRIEPGASPAAGDAVPYYDLFPSTVE